MQVQEEHFETRRHCFQRTFKTFILKNIFVINFQETLLRYVKKYKHRQLAAHITLTLRITVKYNVHIQYQ
jgi:hypothetical protein